MNSPLFSPTASPSGSASTDEGIGHATAIAAVVRVTGGNFRLVDRLVTQIERIRKLNKLDGLTPEIVDDARQALLIGHEMSLETGQLSLRLTG